MQTTRFNVHKWALVLSILVVLNLFIAYSINSVYPEPQYDQVCKREQVVIQPKNQQECVTQGGSWTNDRAYRDRDTYPKAVSVPLIGEEPSGYCNLDYTCSKQFDNAHETYLRNVFVARVIFGVLALGIGFGTFAYEAVSYGFSFGGVLSLLIATIVYWSKLSHYFQVIILGLALAALVWLGVKKVKN